MSRAPGKNWKGVLLFTAANSIWVDGMCSKAWSIWVNHLASGLEMPGRALCGKRLSAVHQGLATMVSKLTTGYMCHNDLQLKHCYKHRGDRELLLRTSEFNSCTRCPIHGWGFVAVSTNTDDC